jgi:hypothetical protein
VTDNIRALPVGRLSLSRITYISDLQRGSAAIPLGVIAEIKMNSLRVLGLIARIQLSDIELASVGRLLRPKMSNPFQLLQQEFEWGWTNTAPGEALRALAERHSQSLFFAPPDEEFIRKSLRFDAGSAAAERLIEELRRRRDEEFWSLLSEATGESKVEPSREIAQLAA